MAEPYTALRNLIAILHDGEDGFAEIAAFMHDADVRAFLEEESYLRAAAAVELERMTYTLSGTGASPGGTRLGAAHRSWLALKAQLGAGDAAILDATTSCEQVAETCYQVAQQASSTPPAIREVLVRQLEQRQRSQAILRELRERLHSSVQP